MSPSEINIEEVILKLESVKRELDGCNSLSELLTMIDTTMETLIQFQNSENISLASTGGELITRLRYVRELRASALALSDEQVEDFSRDFSLIVSSMQFQLWQGESRELLSLIESQSI